MKLTRKKLIWFEQMLEAIEKRATFVVNFIARGKNPPAHTENFSSMEVGGATTVSMYIRGENNYFTFPTDLLYSDEALIRYRDEKEVGEKQRIANQKESEKAREINALKKLAEKYPEFLLQQNIE